MITLCLFFKFIFFLLLLIIPIMWVYSESVWKRKFFYFLQEFFTFYTNVLNTILPQQELPTHIKENPDFPQQKPRRLPNAEVNFEGCCYAGTALLFTLFNVFLHFKHEIGLFTKINFLFVSYLLYLYGPYRQFQLTFEVSRVTSVGTI